MQAGFDQSGLSMDNDLGDPRRQSRLPGGYATQGPVSYTHLTLPTNREV